MLKNKINKIKILQVKMLLVKIFIKIQYKGIKLSIVLNQVAYIGLFLIKRVLK